MYSHKERVKGCVRKLCSWKLINCIYGAYIFLVRDVEFLKRSIKYVWCSMILVIGGFKVFFSNSCDEIDF